MKRLTIPLLLLALGLGAWGCGESVTEIIIPDEDAGTDACAPGDGGGGGADACADAGGNGA